MQNKASTEKALSFPQQEENILSFWEQADIFKKSLEKEAPLGNFVFFEGPPTANGLPGIHHVLARAFKDVIPRYKTMRGYRVLRKAGWDTHGLPVELQVEKELNISGKPDIEKYGIAEFNSQCQKSVWKFKDEWERLTRRIAFWVDMKSPYITYDNSYIESLWWILGQAHEKGLLYKGHKVVPHCPRCGTALSSHEVAQGYKLVKDNSLYLKFKLKENKGPIKAGDFILAWTTTPWTLPGNVALAVGADIEYLRVDLNGEYLILARARAEEVLAGKDYKVVDSFSGKELLDLKYEALFAIAEIANSDNAHKIVEADFVTTEDGTGVVHTAVMYGVDDYELGEKIGLPKVHTVDENGKFKDSLADFDLAGKFVKSAKTEELIIKYLDDKGLLFSQLVYEHDYPFCWRCDTPLLYYAKDSWFIAMSRLKEELISNNAEINWVPAHIKEGRFGEWLNNVKDWAISRERYWGTPLPIWECSACADIKVVSSINELASLSGENLDINSELHRPAIDSYEIPCACGAKMKRVKEVADCWFDSGSMPFAQHHYPFENKELIDSGQQYPAEFICEAIDQTRGWFYTLLAISTLLDKKSAYRNVICLGHINDKFGKKMSKSKGNVINPWEVIDSYGVDAVRQHMYTINQPGESKRYDLDDVKDVFRKNIMLLSNIYRFYQTYQSEGQAIEKYESSNVLDRWLLARLNEVIVKMSSELDAYHVYEAAREIPAFIDDFSTWYLRRSRDRFKSDDIDDKQSALNTSAYTFSTLAKLMAPLMPFMAENIWQKVNGYNFSYPEQSVHLQDWPSPETIDQEVLTQMDTVRKIVELGLAQRDAVGIKIRQMLSSATLICPKDKIISDENYLGLIRDELNIQSIEFKAGDNETWEISLNTELTPELKKEGLKRELIRFINLARKEKGLSLKDRAVVLYQAPEALATDIESLKDELSKETLSSDIKSGQGQGEPKTVKVFDQSIDIYLE